MSEAVTNDDRERLRQTFLIPAEDHSNQWSDFVSILELCTLTPMHRQSLWVDQFVPWDKGVAGPSLMYKVYILSGVS